MIRLTVLGCGAIAIVAACAPACGTPRAPARARANAMQTTASAPTSGRVRIHGRVVDVRGEPMHCVVALIPDESPDANARYDADSFAALLPPMRSGDPYDCEWTRDAWRTAIELDGWPAHIQVQWTNELGEYAFSADATEFACVTALIHPPYTDGVASAPTSCVFPATYTKACYHDGRNCVRWISPEREGRDISVDFDPRNEHKQEIVLITPNPSREWAPQLEIEVGGKWLSWSPWLFLHDDEPFNSRHGWQLRPLPECRFRIVASSGWGFTEGGLVVFDPPVTPEQLDAALPIWISAPVVFTPSASPLAIALPLEPTPRERLTR